MRTLAENFAPYTEAKDMKELGFNDEQTTCFGSFINEKLCLGFFHPTHCTEDTILAPTYSQAFDFFRDKYNLRGFIGFRPNVKQFDYHIYDMSLSGKEYVKQRTMEEYNKDPKVGTYEEAELECLVKLIEIIKEKK